MWEKDWCQDKSPWTLYVRCGEVESITHLLFQCSFSQQVWRMTPFTNITESCQWNVYGLTWDHLKDKICLPPSAVSKGSLSPWILWSLWLSRNKLIFSDTVITLMKTLTSATTMAKEWLEAQSDQPCQNKVRTTVSRCQEAEVILCQSDAI